MEYMMTYGWAVLIVMVAGVVLWRLGIFNISSSIAPTSQGFHILRPVLATCRMEKGVWRPNYNGFSCQFTNNAGAAIKVFGFNISVDGKSCRWMILDAIPTYTAGVSDYIYRTCSSENFACTITLCSLTNPAPSRCQPFGWMALYTIPKDAQFSVMALSNTGVAPGGTIGPCVDITSERKYEVDVELTYEISMGGVTSVKTDNGIIQITGD